MTHSRNSTQSRSKKPATVPHISPQEWQAIAAGAAAVAKGAAAAVGRQIVDSVVKTIKERRAKKKDVVTKSRKKKRSKKK